MEGLGIYWCILEMLYEEGGYLNNSEIERIAFELRTEYDRITTVLQDFELFNFGDTFFFSDGILERLNDRCNKSENARKNVQKRWDKLQKNKTLNTGVLQTEYERNTIKVKVKGKVKDKDKEKIVKKESFTKPSLFEVSEFIKQNQYQVNPEAFVNFYESKGWMVGKNKMRDWRAAVRTWQQKENKNQPKQTTLRSAEEIYKEQQELRDKKTAELILKYGSVENYQKALKTQHNQNMDEIEVL